MMFPRPADAPVVRIERLIVATGQLERMWAFYVDLLGAHAWPLDEPTGGGRAILFDFCGVGIHLVEPLPQIGGERRHEPGTARVVFAVGAADAVDQLTARLAASGHPVIEQPRRSPDRCYRSAVLDPDGNHVGLTV